LFMLESRYITRKCQLLLKDVLFPMKKQCYVVLGTITKHIEIHREAALVNSTTANG
jgi:hypothetical protein